MGFETQEQAERYQEAAEFAADQRREERLLSSQYVATGLEACHKRIAELEAALLICRNYFDRVGHQESVALIDVVLKS